MSAPRYTSRELTKHLRALAIEAHDTTPEGDVITRSQKLAEILWKKALGHTEAVPDRKTGKIEERYNPPEAWAMTMIYERLEGRVANATVEDGGKVSVTDKVSELALERANKLAAAAVGKPPVKTMPPKLLRKKGNLWQTDL